MQMQYNAGSELTACFKQVAYGNTQGIVQEQVQSLITRYPQFRPQVENLEFPGEMRQNFLVVKGAIVALVNGQNSSFPIKIVIPQGFPFHPPRVYLDMQIPMSLVNQKTYLGNQNSIKIPYLNNWSSSYNSRQNPKLVDMMGFLTAVIASDPPVEQGLGAAMMNSGNYFPQQQQVPQQQQQQYNPYSQQTPQNPYPQQYQQQQNYGTQPQDPQTMYTAGQQTQSSDQSTEIIGKIDKLSSQYVEQAQGTLNKLIQSKVEMYKNKQILDEKSELLRQRCKLQGECDSNIQILQQQNSRMEQFIKEQGQSQELNEDNLDSLIYPKDAFSTKIIELTSKENAYEDCLVALKKAYEKDQMNLQEFLQTIRKLSNKQFKVTLKRNKIVTALSGGVKHHA